MPPRAPLPLTASTLPTPRPPHPQVRRGVEWRISSGRLPPFNSIGAAAMATLTSGKHHLAAAASAAAPPKPRRELDDLTFHSSMDFSWEERREVAERELRKCAAEAPSRVTLANPSGEIVGQIAGWEAHFQKHAAAFSRAGRHRAKRRCRSAPHLLAGRHRACGWQGRRRFAPSTVTFCRTGGAPFAHRALEPIIRPLTRSPNRCQARASSRSAPSCSSSSQCCAPSAA